MADTLCWHTFAGFMLNSNPSLPHTGVLLECTRSQCWVLCRFKGKERTRNSLHVGSLATCQ
jgi:hypothetical protein